MSTKKKKKIIEDEEEDDQLGKNIVKNTNTYKKTKKTNKNNHKDEDYNVSDDLSEKKKRKNKSMIEDDLLSDDLDLGEFNESTERKRIKNLNLTPKQNTKKPTRSSLKNNNIDEEITKPIKSNKKKNDSSQNTEVAGVLSGLTFVITGLFNDHEKNGESFAQISRDELSDFIKGLGGKVGNSVSKNTNFLITGSILEDGRMVHESRKYKDAKKKNVKTIDHSDFENLVREKVGIDTLKVTDGLNQIFIKEDQPSDPSEQMVVDQEILEPNKKELWTSKHAPKKIEEIVGNQKVITEFIKWLDDWDNVVLNGIKKEVIFRGKGIPNNPNAKACLISGDPGIGKTTTARLIAKLKGYKTFELNASDQRNKAIISKKLGFLFDNFTINCGEIQGKNLIIMDEIDGMGGNEDRGGVSALIDIIKKTKTPIVCIANDKGHPKLRSLANHCYDLKFNKPDKRLISNRLVEICSLEGIKVEKNALEYLCESVGNDIRQCLNFLEMWSRKFKDLRYSDMTEKYKKFNKDSLLMVNSFEACTKLLNKAQV